MRKGSAFVIDGSRNRSVGQQLAKEAGKEVMPEKEVPLVKKMRREIFKVYTMKGEA